MPLVCWKATAKGYYWIDLTIGQQPCRCMIDSGLVDPLDRVGLSVAPTFYDQLMRSSQLFRLHWRRVRDPHGRFVHSEAGLTTAQLLDPVSRRNVGPIVSVYVSRGVPGVHDRVGVSFFHRLTGCRVIWDLGSRTWCIEYP